MTALPRL